MVKFSFMADTPSHNHGKLIPKPIWFESNLNPTQVTLNGKKQQNNWIMVFIVLVSFMLN